ncbi:hypothetical protein T03_828 [Trichinella britovi]|uniref:Uncharacterized protein n=1 Tax=Trichinella britovi TaxID=45882 RepID=A0A0V1C4Z1_TRIBR|nr:hypothetical protein T03_828 [Trichinella britovi]
MPSMLILGVTGLIFHQQNRLILDHSRLNGMNSTRSTCVITVSNLVTWVSGKMKLQDVNENMLRKFTPLHKFKKDIFSKRIHINKKPPAGGNIHLSLQHWILCRACLFLESHVSPTFDTIFRCKFYRIVCY